MNDLKTIENANIALKNKLYVSGWNLSLTLQKIRENKKKAVVDIFYEDDKAVGVFVIEKNESETMNSIQVFVKKAYRRKGIASQLVERNRIPNVIFKLGEGLYNIEEFRLKNRLIFDYS